MSGEEKRAIELLKDFKKELNNIESFEHPYAEGKFKKILIVLQEENFDIFQTILNLIEKQQKEITKLSEKATNNICANVENEVLEEYRQKIDKQQKIINQLLEDMKERANNFSYESEIMWRKIEKAEKLLEEK